MAKIVVMTSDENPTFQEAKGVLGIWWEKCRVENSAASWKCITTTFDTKTIGSKFYFCICLNNTLIAQGTAKNMCKIPTRSSELRYTACTLFTMAFAV